jgi:hypothetical protein
VRRAKVSYLSRYQVEPGARRPRAQLRALLSVTGLDKPSGTVTTESAELGGILAWNTKHGTVYLVLGGGGAASTLPYGVDPANGVPQANVWVTHRCSPRRSRRSCFPPGGA